MNNHSKVVSWAFACAMIVGQAQASSAVYDLEENNLSQFSGQTLARVTLTDSGGGVDFLVEALIPGTKLSQFAFNFLNNLEPATFAISSLPSSDWSYDVDLNNKGGFNGFGKFDVAVNNGPAHDRVNPLTFSVNVGTVADYVALSTKGSLFAAHVTNLSETGSGSCDGITCTAVTGYAGGGTLVPLPPAIWLFGCGLLGMAAITRRKRFG
jgi:hypothetical protein